MDPDHRNRAGVAVVEVGHHRTCLVSAGRRASLLVRQTDSSCVEMIVMRVL